MHVVAGTDFGDWEPLHERVCLQVFDTHVAKDTKVIVLLLCLHVSSASDPILQSEFLHLLLALTCLCMHSSYVLTA
jgi:hypothetical protein